MGKFVASMVALIIIMIGFGVPAISIYYSVKYNFNSIVAVVISIFALIGGGVLGVLAIEQNLFEDYSIGLKTSTLDKLNLLRAHQRATLEELDDIIDVLKEIRDVLKEASEID
ncbi:MAG: hypothetical protein J7J22_04070 [Candidatus Verstraetearchaeota archaeon]|nr:hypothetical protein [Candidatus Verstraetearchaeota archaeon]